jgi:hypothetical protein
VKLLRLLNTMADCYGALRLPGFAPDVAQEILTEAARNAVNRLPIRPYPDDTRGHDNAATERDVSLEVDECQGS